MTQRVARLEPYRPQVYYSISATPSLSMSNGDDLHLQSDECETVLDATPASGSTETSTVQFLDETPGSTWSIDNSVTTNLVDRQPEIELAKFLSRPVLIKTHTWSQSDSFATTTTWNPWYLFFNSTPIKNKLNNYSFIHCKLKLKFVVNASPFYSGAMAFTYSPLQNLNGTTIVPDSGSGELIPHSQRPLVWIFPQTCQGGEITLPFFYHKNWLDITTAVDTQNMGTITPCLYAPLVSANGVTGSSIVINVYAWAEDVMLHAPTTKLALQSSEFDYKPSQMASAVADATNKLSRIPMIGPYMKATSSVASSISKFASAFGFTNVPNMDTVVPQRPYAFPHNSSCEVSVPTDRTGVDPKNEVTIDPRTVGLDGTDELSLAYIAGRESYLGNAILSSTDSVDALTLVAAVTPCLFYSVNPIDPSKPVQFTPMSYVANMFKYWRGDIIFRFKFICTRFHKGRVRITFDPTNNIATTIPDYTTVFNEVVDIGAEQDIEVRVPYSQATTFLGVNMGFGNYNFLGNSVSFDRAYSNGQLTMRVVNPLSGPVASTAIPVMVFVRAAENIEFAAPSSTPTAFNNSPYALQSKEFEYPVAVKQIVAGNKATTGDPNKYHVHFGESVPSFRPLIHRYSRQYATLMGGILAAANINIISHRTSRRLKYYGYVSDAYWEANKTLTSGVTNFNYVKCNLHQLVSLLFIGQRGSINHSFNVELPASNTQSGMSQVTLQRYDKAINPPVDWQVALAVNATNNSQMAASAFSQIEPNTGVALTDQRLQPALSMNFPYYSNYNFQFVNPAFANKGSAIDGTDIDNIQLQFSLPKVTVNTTSLVHCWSSYGHDYNFFFFINCPSLFGFTPPIAP